MAMVAVLLTGADRNAYTILGRALCALRGPTLATRRAASRGRGECLATMTIPADDRGHAVGHLLEVNVVLA